MPVKFYDTKEAVPAEQREKAFETKDSKWAVDEPVDTAALKAEGQRAIEAERAKAEAEEKARKKAEKELADLKRAQDAKDKGISEDELKKIRDDEEKARKPILDENEQLKAENRKLKLNDGVKSLWLKHGGMEGREEDAMDALLKRAELGDKGNIVLKASDGTATVITKPEDAKAFFDSFKTEKPWYFRGADGSGSGADGGSGGGGGSAYDPAAAGKKAAEQQKATREKNELAFK